MRVIYCVHWYEVFIQDGGVFGRQTYRENTESAATSTSAGICPS